MKTKAKLPGAAGFTIIELLVVVTLTLAMTAIVAPTFQVTPTRRVQNMAHQMVAHLELARSEALGSRRAVRFGFDTSGDQYTAFVDHDGDGTITMSAAEVAAFQEIGVRALEDLVVFGRGSASAFPGDLGAGDVTLTGNVLNIDNQGVPAPWGTMGTIYLQHANDNTAVAAVSVASSGAFRAWRWWPDAGEWR